MIVELKIGQSTYKLSCAENEKEKLLQLAEKLNQRVNNISLSLKNSDEKTLLVVAAIMALEESSRKEVAAAPQKETNQEDLYDAVSENMENICDHLEVLINKIQNHS
jgi:cell division protein ZapA (FtsZ GTPase activity inhibitor)